MRLNAVEFLEWNRTISCSFFW